MSLEIVHLLVEALGTAWRLLAARYLPVAGSPVAHIIVLKVTDLEGTAVDHGEGIVEMRYLVCCNVGRHELVRGRPPY